MDDQHPVEANGMGGRQVRKGKRRTARSSTTTSSSSPTPTARRCSASAATSPTAGTRSAQCAHGTKGESDCAGRSPAPNAWKYSGAKVNGHDQEHVDLVKAIRNDEKHNEGWYGATSSITAVLGRMATYSGQVVKWDDAVAKGPDEMPERLAWDAKPPVLPDDGRQLRARRAGAGRVQGVLTALVNKVSILRVRGRGGGYRQGAVSPPGRQPVGGRLTAARRRAWVPCPGTDLGQVAQ